jgi:hypothetical protein
VCPILQTIALYRLSYLGAISQRRKLKGVQDNCVLNHSPTPRSNRDDHCPNYAIVRYPGTSFYLRTYLEIVVGVARELRRAELAV